ncbi:MAG: hypothetical protein Q7S58_01960 [Candidatus Binatus sp.]|uniref:hypothetical protein n=1 Tax=Candidatus Binatus sp. TaxID=2811406 RepID=UPI00271C6682|nr:hypothetical protein [Candidatus Binatus sp.]MDO8431154.1 hypothetical protein [Candidatus Binatus sp.]
MINAAGAFSLSPIVGRYAFYQRNKGLALFSRNRIGLGLVAFNQPKATAAGTFISAARFQNSFITVRVHFSGGKIHIAGDPRFGGAFPVVINDGVISFSNPACQSGTCYSVHSNELGVLDLPQIAGGIFWR